MLDDIAEGIPACLYHLIVEAVFFYTGEIILCIITLGHKKPRWDYYSDESLSKWGILIEISTWISMLFWIFLAIWIGKSLV